MKIELNRLEFLKAWQIAERSSSTKSTISAAGGVLISVDEGVVLEATDFKTAVRCSASGVTVARAGSAVLPVRLFGDFLKKISTETIGLEINSGTGVLVAGRNRARFSTFPVLEFPNIPRSGSAEPLCSVVTADLSRTIAEGSVASSMSADVPKYLGACLLRISGGLLKIVSTDSKRLSLSQCPCEEGGDERLLLPSQALKELSRLLSAADQEARIRILHDGSTVWFCSEGLEFSIRRVESSFPDYERILTSDVLTSLRLQRDDLLSALERIDIISRNTPIHLVVMQLSPGGDLQMSAKAPELGTAFEVLSASISGEPLQIGFNVTYLQDGLRALGAGEICIEFNGREGQTRMTRGGTDGFLYMLMPAKFNDQDLIDAEAEDASGGPVGALEPASSAGSADADMPAALREPEEESR